MVSWALTAGGGGFLVVGYGRAGIANKVSVLLAGPLSYSFDWSEQTFLRAFFVDFCWLIVLAVFSSAQFTVIGMEKENAGDSLLCCSVNPKVPSSPAFPFLLLSVP